MTDKEQIAHDLALLVVSKHLEDCENDYGVKQLCEEAIKTYKSAKEEILKSL